MVDAQNIVEPELKGKPPNPPGEPFPLHPLPVKEGVAPKLSTGGKPVRRTACHLGGQSVLVQLELLRGGPYVGAVPCGINGQIANHRDSQAVDIPLERPPLAEKEVLDPLPEIRFPLQLLSDGGQDLRSAQAQLLRPLEPGRAAVTVLQGHKQGVILQPVPLFPAEVLKVRGTVGQKPAARFAQDGVAGGIHQAVVNPFRTASPVDALIFLPFQQPFPFQLVQVDKVGVPGKGGEGLIGGIPVTGGADRQNLPARLARLRQKVREAPRLFPQRSDAIGGGKGKNGHQNSGFSHTVHLLLLKFCIME